MDRLFIEPYDGNISEVRSFWLECIQEGKTPLLIEGGTVYIKEDGVRKREYLSRFERELKLTDYIVTKISEAQAMGEDIEPLKQKYADVLSMRRQWRARINELESQNDTQIQVN